MKIGDLVRYLSTVFMSKTMPNTVGGSIYADTADVYDIGSEDKPFHHIYAQEITAPLGGGGGGLGMVGVIEGDVPGYLANKVAPGENISLEVYEEDDGTKRLEIVADGGGVFTKPITVEDFTLLDEADVPIVTMKREDGYFKLGAASDLGGIERVDNVVRVSRDSLWPNDNVFDNVAIGADAIDSNTRLLIDAKTSNIASLDIRGGGQSGRGWPSDPSNAQKLVYLTHKIASPPTGLLGMVGAYMAYTGNLSTANATMEAFEVVNVIQSATHSPSQALLGAEIVAGLNPAGTNMSSLTFPNIWAIYGNVDAPSANSGTITWARSGCFAFPSMTNAGGNVMTNAANLYLTSGQSVTPSVTATNAYGLYVENPPAGSNKWAIYATGKIEISETSMARLKLVPASGFFSIQARTSNDGDYEAASFFCENFTVETGSGSTSPRLSVYDTFSRFTNRLQWNVPTSEPSDSVLEKNEILFWIDEDAGQLNIKVKRSDDDIATVVLDMSYLS